MWRAEVRQANPNHVRVGYRVKRRHLIFGVGARWPLTYYRPTARHMRTRLRYADNSESGGANVRKEFVVGVRGITWLMPERNM